MQQHVHCDSWMRRTLVMYIRCATYLKGLVIIIYGYTNMDYTWKKLVFYLIFNLQLIPSYRFSRSLQSCVVVNFLDTSVYTTFLVVGASRGRNDNVDVCGIRHSRESDVQLTMRKDRMRQVHSNNIHRLPLRFVDGNAHCGHNRELLPEEFKSDVGDISGRHLDSRYGCNPAMQII